MLKCYDVPNGCKGWVPKWNRYVLFASYRDFVEFMEENS